ncbi:MAG: pseudouridine synthase [Bacteroidales bacterium]|nr:pseudouridine synthase [Bacteroidales bacterium]
MENNRRGGNGRRTEGRREYGSRGNSERRPRINEHKSYGNDERRSFGGDKKPYGAGERRSFGAGDRKPSFGNGERRSFGNGERRSFGNGERRSFGAGDRKPSFGNSERRSFGNGERRSFGAGDRKPSFGNGERRSFNNNDRGERRSFGSKGNGGNFGGKKSFYKKDFNYFRDEDESGINRMINNRKSNISNENYSDNDLINIPVKEEVRLNKYIANSGVCSRREADNFILAGVVTVNGEVVTELGTKVNIYTDDVRFNGERLKGESKVYILMNKPKGYVTTASDPHADKTVMDLLKGCPSRVFPVGRLDKNTTGVLMFTNDGEIAEKLTHPSYDKKKIYQVSLDSKLKQEDYEKILSGIELPDGVIAADELEYIEEDDHRKVGIEIHSGKNRIVRRIFESLGYEVKALDRVYFAGLTKKGVKRGDWRYLTEGEINLLKMGAYL